MYFSQYLRSVYNIWLAQQSQNDAGILQSKPDVPNPVVCFWLINEDEAPNPVADVFPNRPPVLVLVDKPVKPVEPAAPVLRPAS